MDWMECIGCADKKKIVKMVNNFEFRNQQRNVFGEGKASVRIAEILEELQ